MSTSGIEPSRTSAPSRGIVMQTTSAASPLLNVEGLDVAYGQSQVINNLSLKVKPNEIVAILGLTGMGKRRLMKSLSGLLPAKRGSTGLGGEDLRHGVPFDPRLDGAANGPPR